MKIEKMKVMSHYERDADVCALFQMLRHDWRWVNGVGDGEM